MDRKGILVLKPDAVVIVRRVLCSPNRDKIYPTLNKRLLCQPFLTTIDAINYAIAVKHRYLKLKEYECMNQPTI